MNKSSSTLSSLTSSSRSIGGFNRGSSNSTHSNGRRVVPVNSDGEIVYSLPNSQSTTSSSVPAAANSSSDRNNNLSADETSERQSTHCSAPAALSAWPNDKSPRNELKHGAEKEVALKPSSCSVSHVGSGDLMPLEIVREEQAPLAPTPQQQQELQRQHQQQFRKQRRRCSNAFSVGGGSVGGGSVGGGSIGGGSIDHQRRRNRGGGMMKKKRSAADDEGSSAAQDPSSSQSSTADQGTKNLNTTARSDGDCDSSSQRSTRRRRLSWISSTSSKGSIGSSKAAKAPAAQRYESCYDDSEFFPVRQLVTPSQSSHLRSGGSDYNNATVAVVETETPTKPPSFYSADESQHAAAFSPTLSPHAEDDDCSVSNVLSCGWGQQEGDEEQYDRRTGSGSPHKTNDTFLIAQIVSDPACATGEGDGATVISAPAMFGVNDQHFDHGRQAQNRRQVAFHEQFLGGQTSERRGAHKDDAPEPSSFPVPALGYRHEQEEHPSTPQRTAPSLARQRTRFHPVEPPRLQEAFSQMPSSSLPPQDSAPPPPSLPMPVLTTLTSMATAVIMDGAPGLNNQSFRVGAESAFAALPPQRSTTGAQVINDANVSNSSGVDNRNENKSSSIKEGNEVAVESAGPNKGGTGGGGHPIQPLSPPPDRRRLRSSLSTRNSSRRNAFLRASSSRRRNVGAIGGSNVFTSSPGIFGSSSVFGAGPVTGSTRIMGGSSTGRKLMESEDWNVARESKLRLAGGGSSSALFVFGVDGGYGVGRSVVSSKGGEALTPLVAHPGRSAPTWEMEQRILEKCTSGESSSNGKNNNEQNSSSMENRATTNRSDIEREKIEQNGPVRDTEGDAPAPVFMQSGPASEAFAVDGRWEVPSVRFHDTNASTGSAAPGTLSNRAEQEEAHLNRLRNHPLRRQGAVYHLVPATNAPHSSRPGAYQVDDTSVSDRSVRSNRRSHRRRGSATSMGSVSRLSGLRSNSGQHQPHNPFDATDDGTYQSRTAGPQSSGTAAGSLSTSIGGWLRRGGSLGDWSAFRGPYRGAAGRRTHVRSSDSAGGESHAHLRPHAQHPHVGDWMWAPEEHLVQATAVTASVYGNDVESRAGANDPVLVFAESAPKNRRDLRRCVAMQTLLVVGLAMVLVVLLVTRRQERASGVGVRGSNDIAPPTNAPSNDAIFFIPPLEPARPELSRPRNMTDLFRVFGDFSTLESLNDEGSPQYKAMQWLSRIDRSNRSLNDPRLLQRYVMAVIYFSFDGMNSWSDSVEWMMPLEDECSWGIGVSCDDWGGSNHVVSLDLSRYGLSGKIPDEIRLLQHLEVLRLNENSVYGTMPAAMGELRKLQILEMRNNRISGILPSSLSGMANLEIMDVSHNGLDGSLPMNLYDLSGLRVMDVSWNNLAGTLSSRISNLRGLTMLHASGNQFTGQIPTSMASLSALASLHLDHNSFRDGVSHLGAILCHVEVFTASNNNFSGQLPDDDACLDGSAGPAPLRKLDLSSNFLSGPLPVFLTEAKSLEYLDLSDNRLSGTMLYSWEEASNLEYVDLSHNTLSGNLPSFGANCALKYLNLQENNLLGPIPKDFGSYCPSLEFLSFSSNSLRSTLPESFAGLIDLRVLTARNCGLVGSLPDNLGHMKSLDTLDLGRNDLTGSLPSGIGDLGALVELRLDNNRLTGQLPQSLMSLRRIRTLDLQGNLRLYGSIPENICESAQSVRRNYTMGIGCDCCS